MRTISLFSLATVTLMATLLAGRDAPACEEDALACEGERARAPARATAPTEATLHSAASIAERAAQAAGGRSVHEVDGRQVVVRGGGLAAARAIEVATGARVVQAGLEAVRLEGAREDAALAALTPAQREQLTTSLRGLRVRLDTPTARDAIDVRSTLLAAEAVSAARPEAASGDAPATAAGGVTLVPLLALPAPGAHLRPGFYDTTEFLAGRIAVNVIFVESTRPGRAWSREDRDDATSDLVEALDMWAQRCPKAGLSFRYRTYRTTTSLQPIEESSLRRDRWIEEAMEQLRSAPHGSDAGWQRPYLNVYELNNRARRELATDWAFTVFFVRAANRIREVWDAATGSLESSSFTFADGKAAFAMLGGPYLVMPFSKVWGVHLWNTPILTHEFGHIFHARDEYEKYAAEGHAPNERSGYFAVENQNLDARGAASDVSCIMRGSLASTLDWVLDHIVRVFTFGATPSWSYPVCAFTKGQVGYRDRDGNGRLDTFDAAPTLSASGAIAVDGCGTRTLRISAVATVGATANRNPYATTIHPASERRDLSVDSLLKLRWRVLGGAWREARPGAVGAPGGRFSLSLALPASASSALVEIEAVTRAGARTSRAVTARTAPVAIPTRVAAAGACD